MKKLFLLSVLILLPMLASADAVEINGIYYNLLEGAVAEVTKMPNDGKYSGSVVIPESVIYEGKTYSVTSIGNSTFKNCSGLTSVTIPNSVTSIGRGAFSVCRGLTSVTIPNSVTSIDNNAFWNCSGLTSLTIPNSVASIGVAAFERCSGLISINVESGNPNYDSRNNCNAIIETSSNTLIAGCKNTTIPNNVTSIGNNAFVDCSGLTSLTIPNSVTSIGSGAFIDCSALTSVTIPNRVTSIGEGAFSGCSGLSSIKVENGNPNYDSRNNCNAIIETSSNRLIAGCMNTIIPNGVTLIGSGVFSGCSGLTSVTIPNSVTTIGNAAFFSCSGLTSVTIPNSVTTIGEWAFADCSGLTEVISEIQNPFSIDDYVFDGISRNAKLQVPTGTKSKYKAFSGWTKYFKVIVDTEENNTSTKRTIHVATAGTLPNLILGAEKYMIEELTLTGELNGTDFRLLRDIAGCNYLGQDTDGRLTVLDLSNAKIVAGGETYLETNRIKGYNNVMIGNFQYSVSNNNVLPQYVFYLCNLKIVSTPNSVTEIGDGAFKYCSDLTSVTIGNSVTTIGASAFDYCTGLTSVTFPNSVTSISYGVFAGCSSLTSVSIPNSVVSIDEKAFKGCSGLISVTIPNSVTSIGIQAFSGCSGLTSVTIPNSVTSIGESVFYNCSDLTSIKVENGNPNYDSRNNCNAIIETSSNTLIIGCKSTVIPNSVTSIGEGAFDYCSGLTSVTIPNSVTSIGQSAFSGCSGLTSVTIPNSVTSIGQSAFSGCSGLTSVTIPNSVTSIGNYAFAGCSGLTSVTIPNRVKSIGEGAFSGCCGLSSIKVENGNPKYDSRNNCNAIIETSSNRLIAGCMNTIIPNGVTLIGSGVFAGCSGLTSVTIPNSVKIIGDNAFSGCSGLTSVTIPNSVKIIGDHAFSGCSGLTSVTIPNSMTYIYDFTFSGCSGLTSVTIPNSVTSVGHYAFQYCSSLTSVTIPNRVTSIGWRAFYGCSGLTEVISKIQNPFVIDDNVFEGISRNAILQVPTGEKSKYEAFSGWTKNFKEIVEAEGNNTSTKRTIHVATAGTLPNLISEAEKYDIEELTLTGELNGTDFRLLRDMAGNNYLGQDTEGRLTVLDLSNATIVAGGEKYLDTSSIKGNGGSISGNHRYSILDNNEIPQFAFYACDLKIASIPNSVTSIGYFAFGRCIGLTSVTISNSVTSIGDDAFYKCSGLTSVTIPSSVTSIGNQAFDGCSGLTSITIPNSVTYIGSVAFPDCSGLTSIKVESGNPKYDSRNNCNAIIETSSNTLIVGCKNTIIPNSVTSISQSAFFGCSGLTSVTIPNSVASIGGGAFAWCSGLTSMTIPNSVSSIGRYAFQYCSALTSVTIPISVTSIGDGAFNGCSGLTEVKSMIQEPYEINQNCWKDVNTDIIPLYVLKDTKLLYEATTGWNVFKNIIEMDDLLDSVEENGGVDFGGEDGLDEDSNLNGNVIGNIYYSIDDNNGEYSSEEGCIILKKPTSDEEMENLEGQDIFGEDFNENFTGIVFMVSEGCGTIKVNAESVGNMTLKVKIGDGAPMTFELEGKMKASFPYSVTEPTYVYIYGGETDSNNARSVRSVGENALKIYGIEWTNEPSGIDDIRVNTKAIIYNINGQRVQTPGKGIYIMNGKKVVMK